MNITDADGLWRLTPGKIENRKTGEVHNMDKRDASHITSMPYGEFLRKCAVAFHTGVWPKTYWSSGRITD